MNEYLLKLKNKFGKVGSWALWDENGGIEEIIKDKKFISSIKPHIIFMGLNPSEDLLAKTDWVNFHFQKGRNPWGREHASKLADVLSEREFSYFRGAYMTDVIKTHYYSNSKYLMKAIKNDPNIITKNGQLMKQEMELLSKISGSDNFIIICNGEKSFDILSRLYKGRVYSIWHYSAWQLGWEGVKKMIREDLREIMKREQSGEAPQNAKFIYEELNRQEIINDTLPKASKFQKVFILSDSAIIEPNLPKHENRNLSGTEQLRKKYFEELLKKTNSETDLFDTPKRKPISGKRHRLEAEFTEGINEFALSYDIRENKSRVELYIRTPDIKNKSIFDILYKDKDEIEKDFGSALDWSRNNSKKSSQIRKWFDKGGFVYHETWPELQDEMVDTMVKFEKIFRPRLKAIAR